MDIKMGNGSSILISDKGDSVKPIFQDDKYIITNQAEQIKMLRGELSKLYHRGVDYINADDYPDEEDRATLEAYFNECLIQSKAALEATKEQA